MSGQPYKKNESSMVGPRLSNFFRLLGYTKLRIKTLPRVDVRFLPELLRVRGETIETRKTVKRKWRRHAERSCETRRPHARNCFCRAEQFRGVAFDPRDDAAKNPGRGARAEIPAQHAGKKCTRAENFYDLRDPAGRWRRVRLGRSRRH